MAGSILLSQLLPTQTLDSIRAKVLGKLQSQGLPTTDWSATGYERAIVEMVALALQDLVVNGLPQAVGGGFVDYATGDWLTFNSAERFNNPRNVATYTQGTILLTNATGSPIILSQSQLGFLFPSENVYQGPVPNAVTGLGPTWTVPANGTLSITVQSESPNHSVATGPNDTAPIVNYVDSSNQTITLTTSVAGLSATNPAPLYSTVTQTGVGSGVVTTIGTPSGTHNLTIRIDTSGQVGGSLVYSYSLDGGAYATGLVASSQTNIGGFGIGFSLANGAGTPSFTAGTFYGFSCPGTWITQQGTDQETDPALASRDKARWPSLATLAAIPGSPTLAFYDLLARQASSQVTQTLIQTDTTINNKVNIYVAGQGGVLPGSVLATIQAYLNNFAMLTDSPVALSPTPLTITLGGLTITVKQASLASAQAALQSALQTYFASLGINASTTSGTIRHARIIQIIEDIFGVVDVSDTTMTINGATQSLLLPTVGGQAQLPQWSQAIATAATWVTV